MQRLRQRSDREGICRAFIRSFARGEARWTRGHNVRAEAASRS